jgi:hypothetical protein
MYAGGGGGYAGPGPAYPRDHGDGLDSAFGGPGANLGISRVASGSAGWRPG